MSNFDLQLYSIHIDAGQEKPNLPGVLVMAAPKKSARARTTDTLAILFTIEGTSPFTENYLQDVLQEAAADYFKSQGSVTSGIRVAVEFLNETLLDLNLKSARDGNQATALLNLAVLHEDTLFIAHSGPTHTFAVDASQVDELFDDTVLGRFLGVGKAFPLRFFQVKIQPNTLIVFSPKPPVIWDGDYLAGSGLLNLDALRRRLLNQAGTDLQSLIVRFVPGKGLIYRRKLMEDTASQPVPPPSNVVKSSVVAPTPISPAISPARLRISSEEKDPAIVSSSLPADEPAPEFPAPVPSDSIVAMDDVPLSKPITPRTNPIREPGKIRQQLAHFWLGLKRIGHKVDKGARVISSKVVPRLSQKKPVLSTSAMLFIAIVIPMVIVAIGATVYIQRGRRVQHDYYIQQAQEMVAYAQSEPDRNLQLIYWQQAMAFLIQAEDNGKTAQSQSMHDAIQTNLDSLQGIVRIQLQLAIFEGIPNTVNLIKVVSNYDGLYVLDSSVGRILHLTRKDQFSFELDYEFACGPVGGTLVIGPLVDMVALPINNIELEPDKPAGASVMGIDATGNILYCASGKNPVSRALPAPAIGWGKIQAAALNEDSGALNVLDTQTNRVWMFESEGYLYNIKPTSFFDAKLPQDIKSVINIAVNGHDLYLLHNDNQMTRCTFSGLKEIKQTECPDDPAIYQDMRQGGAAQSLTLQGIQFTQMQLIRLPDSAIYLLNSLDPSLFKFGFQLNLFKQFQFGFNSEYPLPAQNATGFGISTDQLVFIAFGNQLYFGQVP